MAPTLAPAPVSKRKQNCTQATDDRLAVLDTQFGEFGVVFNADWQIIRTHFMDYPDDDPNEPWASAFARIARTHPKVRDVMKRIEAYFKGDLKTSFAAIPTPAGPPFYHRCWNTCRRIKPGTTISYAELAERSGSPMASRAAGQAMRNNPVPIIVPCHRIIGHNGHLGGFSGSNAPSSVHLQLKRGLLDFESTR